LTLAAFATAGCGGPAVVQIGAIVSLEGSAAPYGRSVWNGIQVAAAQINAEGGIDVAEGGTRVPLEILMRDDQSDPQIGMQVAQELIDLGVPAVIGAISSDVTLRVADLFQQAHVILLSPSTSTPALTSKGSYIYRNFPSDELEAVNMGAHIYNVAGINQVDVVGSQSEFGLGIKNAFIERFRSLGGQVTSQVSFEAGATDLSAQAQQLAGTQAGGIYIAGYSDETAHVARALRDAGITLPLFGTGAILPGELVRIGGDAVEGLIYPTATFDPDSEEVNVRRFVAGYRDMFGEGFDVYAAHGYDAVMILAQAIEQNGMRTDNMTFYMNAMNPFPGAAGVTSFDDDGNARKTHRMMEIRGGQAVPFAGQ
jgi:branched-chain amino acid transport system substrate-binding protein